jgi:hypothetical protein
MQSDVVRESGGLLKFRSWNSCKLANGGIKSAARASAKIVPALPVRNCQCRGSMREPSHTPIRPRTLKLSCATLRPDFIGHGHAGFAERQRLETAPAPHQGGQVHPVSRRRGFVPGAATRRRARRAMVLRAQLPACGQDRPPARRAIPRRHLRLDVSEGGARELF